MSSAHPQSKARPYALTLLLFSVGYTSYALCKGLFVLAATPILILLLPFSEARYRFLQFTLRGFLNLFTRGWLPALGVYRLVEVSGLERALAGGSFVLAANHRSLIDTLLLLSFVPRLGVVIKARDTNTLLYAVLTRTFDLVSIDPHKLSSVAAGFEATRRILAVGRRLLIYPEGMRARSGRLQPFHPLAFELACKAGVTVIPVLVHSTVPFMSKIPDSTFPRERVQFRIRFLDPEPPQPDDTAESLGDRVHRRMAAELKALDAGTAWETAKPKPK